MNEQIKQIAQRLAGLRDVLELTSAEVAAVCGIPEDKYIHIESGEVDIPVSLLHQISQHYGVDMSALMFGDDSKMNAYFLTRKGQAARVSRSKAYDYQSLAAGFIARKADPYIVTVAPNERSIETHLNTHPGQEFNMVLEGRLMLHINDKELILEEGDSIYFDSTLPHGMKAMDGKPVKFLAIII